MKTITLFSLLLFLSFPSLFSQSTLTIGNTIVQADTVRTGLDVPWEMEWGSDSQLWITERKGLMSRINPVTSWKSQILDITQKVFAYAESGLLGFAFHPEFGTTPEVFMAYNFGSMQGVWERIVKYTYSGGILVNEVILIDSIKGAAGHNGARLLFLPDKTLLVTLGEAQDVNLSQDMTSLNGKIIRLNTDGSIPSDNPIPNSYIYSWGHRNPQGLAWGPAGNIYTSEHGATTSDEFQLLEKNRNYGWPHVEGSCDSPQEITYCQQQNVKEPMREWTPTLAVGDLVWYNNSLFPELDNRMLMATLKDKSLVALQLDQPGLNYISENIYLKNIFGRLRAVAVGPSKEIYLATNGANSANTDAGTHNIIRLSPPFSPTGITVSEKRTPSFHPNPAADILYLNDGEYSFVMIRDGMGRILLETTTGTSGEIDISGLAAGIYSLEIINDSRTHRGKLIKL